MSKPIPTDRPTMAAYIEHTFLKPDGPSDAVQRLCDEARENHFVVAMVHPAELDHARECLAGSDVRLGTVIGFPLGQNSSLVKAHETDDALNRGAKDLDIVINIRALTGGQPAIVRRELAQLAEACRQAGAVSKAIIETGLITEQQTTDACRITLDSGVDYIKTSTGFNGRGASVQDIRLIRSVVGSHIKVKAAGGIRDLPTAMALIESGADRLGTSSGMAILTSLSESS